MASFPRWLDKARATGARLINPDRDASDARRPTKAPSTNGKSASWRARRELDVDYADIPSFLLPLDLRVRLDKEERKAHSRSRAAPYDKSSVSSRPASFSLFRARGCCSSSPRRRGRRRSGSSLSFV